MTRARRLPVGGSRIERSRPVSFTFDSAAVEGYAGDTIASALLAKGVDIVGRGAETQRPRGIFSAGVEEPNALLQVTWPSGASEPLLRATVVEIVQGLAATSLAGRGRLVSADDGRFDKRYVHVEELIVGGGRSGRAAAAAAVVRDVGDRVMLVDDGPALESIDGALTLARTTALGIYDHGYVVLAERRPGRRTEGRLWHVRAGRIVLATGATERPIVFPDNDRPGIMLASAARAYVERFAVLPGTRVVAYTTNESGIASADAVAAAGAELVEVVDSRTGSRVTGTEADVVGRLDAVLVEGRRLEADLLLVSGGWNPNVALWSQARGSLRYADELGTYVPDGTVRGVEIIGRAAGAGISPSRPPSFDDEKREDSSFVDLERDATVADVRRAVGAGLTSIEHVKRYTTIGTGSGQGKTGGVVSSAVATTLLGQEPGSLGVPTFRPPDVPVAFAQLAGRDRGALYDPIRTTAMHRWHVEHGAVFEDVGQWKRARYYPRDGETMDDAVLRECAATRAGVGVVDASTLGKIDLQGPDVGLFLDRIYTNVFSTLKVGSCRYGLMCAADGMVLDDGVTSRLAEDRYLMTTTTGNVASVYEWLEEWLQTEWPELRVHATSVTEQWATIAVVGPRSRDLVRELAPELAVEAVDFAFMTWRDAEVAGVPARVFRISFSGELAYEINVPAWYGPAIWEAVMAAGVRYGITPYGTEAMHVLRAEKGYAIVGQETDGTVTPLDLGMEWIVSKKKSFVGKRAFARSDTSREDRRQLVGLLPVDPDTLLPEGAQLVFDPDAPVPMPIVGHVTSSYQSAALGRTFALAMVEAGRSRIGTTVHAPLRDRTIAATIHDAVLFDPENERRDGEPDR